MPTPATDEPRISLLYVDDEPALLEITRLFLERNGNYSVSTCDNPHDALRIIPQSSFDAIISDYQMPECDGISFLRHLRKIGNKTPFIIFTGKGREDIVIQALNEGADFYLQKGGDPKSQFAELSNKVRYAVTRKRGEEALRESEERYKNVVETQAEIICRFLPDGTHIFVNEAYCRRFNRTAEELIGKRFKPEIHPDDAGEVARFFASLTPDHPVGMLEERIILPDGSIIWYRFNTRAFFNEDGTIHEYQSVGQDITELKDRERQLQLKNEELAAAEGEMRAAYEQLAASEEEIRSQLDENIAIQRQLALSEEQYRAIFEHTEAPTVILEEDTSISLANSAFAETSGYSQEEVIGRSWTEFVSRPDLDRMLAHHRARREEGADPPTKYEFTFLNRHGEAREISLTVGMIPGTRQSVASFHDLTDVRMGERAVRESEEQYRRIVDTSAEGIWQLDPLFRITYVNRQMAEMLGYSPGEMIGMDATSFIPPDEMADSEMRKAGVQRGEVDHFERRYIRRDGSSFWAQVAITPILDAEGGYQGSFSMITNVSERKAAEEELRKLAMVVKYSSELINLSSADGRMIFVNEAGSRMLGISPDDVGQHLITDVIPEKLQRLVQNELLPALIEKGTWEGDLQYCNLKTNALTDVHAQCFTIRDEKTGAPLFMANVSLDITERKAAEKTLLQKNEELTAAEEELRQQVEELAAARRTIEEREEHLQAVSNNIPGGIVYRIATDPAGNRRLIYVSAAIERILGITQAEALDDVQKVYGLVLDEDRERLIEAEEMAIQTLDPFLCEVRFQKPDSTIRWVQIQSALRKLPDGSIIGDGIILDITDRKAAEVALRESEERYREIFNSVNSAIWIHDISTFRFVHANTAMHEMFGYTREEAMGLNISDISSNEPPFTEETGLSFLKKAASGKPQIFDWHCRHKDGHLFWSEVNLRRGTIAGKEYILAIHRDITDRKAAEVALQESEERFSRAIAATGAGLWDWDMINDRVYFSHQWKSMLGYDDHEIEDTFAGWKSLWHPDDAPRIEKAVSDYLQGRTKSYEVEHRLRHKDGSWRWILTRGDIERDTEGRAVRWTGTNIDITEQKTQSEELEGFFRVNLDLLCIADLDGNFIKTNQMWGNVLGYSTEELSNRKFLEFVHPDDMQPTLDTMADLSRGEDVLNFTNRYICKDGSYRYIEWRSHPKGNVIYAAARDITDRKGAEEALHTVNKKLKLLSSITRHDILNQIMVLQGYLDLSLSEINDPPLSGYLTKALKAATTIQRQIEFTKAYESLGVHTPTWQPLSPLIDAIDDSLLPIHHDCCDFSVYADPMFGRVLENLYDNTIRHAEGADSVTIRCEERDSDLIIIWEDNGPGIPDDQKERIFDKGVGKNTGLGLFLTREILSITGIAISETGVSGEGARFEIRVPAGGFSVT